MVSVNGAFGHNALVSVPMEHKQDPENAIVLLDDVEGKNVTPKNLYLRQGNVLQIV